jgi:hypothetical protein
MGTPAQRLESERAKFPAMQVDEILVWRNWLQIHEKEYQRFDYNARLGIAVDPGPDFPDYVRKAAIASRSLRIDAVGYQGDLPTIFEVKRRAGLQNVGQLFGYFHMWQAQQLSAQAPLLVLVCADFSQHILPATSAAGIRIDVVPTNFSFLSPHAAKRTAP